eukprot:scaffold140817_cov16-Prasinocladus_malaysianus.AAC.1
MQISIDLHFATSWNAGVKMTAIVLSRHCYPSTDAAAGDSGARTRNRGRIIGRLIAPPSVAPSARRPSIRPRI